MLKISKFKIGWGYTSLCNMRCPFCYSYNVRQERSTDITDTKPYLAFVISHLENIDSINWGTGENSLSSRWFDLIAQIHQSAPMILQAVTTNGYLGHIISQREDFFDVFKNCVDDVDISLDFSDPDLHNGFRGNPLAFDWAIQTIKLCMDMNKPRTIVMLGCNETLHEDNIKGLMRLADKFGCNLRINIFRPVSGLSLPPARYDQVKESLKYIVSNYKVISLGDSLFAALFGGMDTDPTGISSMRILPDGSITPSTYLVSEDWRAANILHDNISFESLVQSKQFQVFRSRILPDECKTCMLQNSCHGGVKDRRLIWYSTLHAPDPYCPARHDGDFDWLKTIELQYEKCEGPLIHKGYLPTLIFHP